MSVSAVLVFQQVAIEANFTRTQNKYEFILQLF